MVPISLSIYCSRLKTVAFNLNVVFCSVSKWLTSSLVVSQLAVVLFLPWGLGGINVCPFHQDLLSTLFIMNWCHQHIEGTYLFVPSFFKIKGSFFVYLKIVTLSSLINRYCRVAVSIYSKLWVRQCCVKLEGWGECAARVSHRHLSGESSCVVILKNYCAVHCQRMEGQPLRVPVQETDNYLQGFTFF